MADNPADTLAAKIAHWKLHPEDFVRDLWGAEPDPAQLEACEALGRAVASGDKRKIRIALLACAGVGKSCWLAWMVWWGLLCWGEKKHHPFWAVFSMDGGNLESGLWKELAAWYARSDLLQYFFDTKAEEIVARCAPKTWKAEKKAWARKANADEMAATLSGRHARYNGYAGDESGNLPLMVGLRCEQGMTDPDGWGWIFTGGNPVDPSSMLGECSRDPRFTTISMTGDPDDPRCSPRVDKEQNRRMIQLHGRDNPWVQIYILGRFPDDAVNVLLSHAQVDEAEHRRAVQEENDWAPKIIGVDVGGGGLDPSVIARGQGRILFPFVEMRCSSGEGADYVARTWADWDADACHVDATGGFGAGWCDRLEGLNYPATRVQFGGKASQPDRYYRKRDEMIWRFREWVLEGGSLPVCPRLREEVTTVTYSTSSGVVKVESKDTVRPRLNGRSTDYLDAAGLIHAYPAGRRHGGGPVGPEQTRTGKPRMAIMDQWEG